MTACDPLTREECCDGTPCEGCRPFDRACDACVRGDGVVQHTCAPPLSPTEQATVDRFEAAPDPWEET